MMNKCSVCFIEIPVEGSEVKQTSGYFDQLIQYRHKDLSLFDGQVARCVQFQQKGSTDCEACSGKYLRFCGICTLFAAVADVSIGDG
jgi:hypothetical protein